MKTGSSLTTGILYRMQHGREACQCHMYIYATRNYYWQFSSRGHIPLLKNLHPLSPQTLQITFDSISDHKFILKDLHENISTKTEERENFTLPYPTDTVLQLKKVACHIAGYEPTKIL